MRFSNFKITFLEYTFLKNKINGVIFMNSKFRNAALGAAVFMSVVGGASTLEAAPITQNAPTQGISSLEMTGGAPEYSQSVGGHVVDDKFFKSPEYLNSIKGFQIDEKLMKKNPALRGLNGMIRIPVDKTVVDWNIKPDADGFTEISNNDKAGRFPGRLDKVNTAFKEGIVNINDPGTLTQKIFGNKSLLLMHIEKHNQDTWRNGGFSYNYTVKNTLKGNVDVTVTHGDYWKPHSDFKDYKPSCLTPEEYVNFKTVFPEGFTERNAALVPYFAQSNRNFRYYYLSDTPDITEKEYKGIRRFNPRAFNDNNPVSKALRDQFGIDSVEQSKAASGVKQVAYEFTSQSPEAKTLSPVGQTTHDETIHIPAVGGKNEHLAARGAKIAAMLQLKKEGKNGYVDKVTCLGPNGDGTYKFDVSCKVYDTANTAIRNMSFDKDGLMQTNGIYNVPFQNDDVASMVDQNRPMTASEIDGMVTHLDQSDIELLQSVQAEQKARDMLTISESTEYGPFGLDDFSFVPGKDGRGTASLEYVLPQNAGYSEQEAADYGFSATKDYLGSQGRLTADSNISVADVTRLNDGDLVVEVDATNIVPKMSKSYDLEDAKGTKAAPTMSTSYDFEDVKGIKVPEPFSIKDVMSKSEELVKSTADLASAKVSEKVAGVALNEHMSTYVNGGSSFFDKIKTKMAVMSEFGSIEKLNEQTNKLSDRAADAVRNTSKASQAFDKSVDSLRQSVAETCSNDPKVMKSFERFASDANAFKYAVNEGTDKNTRSAQKQMKESYKAFQGELKNYGKSYELNRETIRRDDELSKAPSIIRPGMTDKQVCQVLLNKEMSGGAASLSEAEKAVMPELIKRFGSDSKGNIDVEKGIQRTSAALNGVSSNHITNDSKAEVYAVAKGIESKLNVSTNAKADISKANSVSKPSRGRDEGNTL